MFGVQRRFRIFRGLIASAFFIGRLTAMPARSATALATLVLASANWLLLPAIGASGANDVDTLRSIAEGYSSHRDSFDPMRLEYRIRDLTARSIEDAVAGHFLEGGETRIECLLVVSGNTVLSQKIADDSVARAIGSAAAKGHPKDKAVTVAVPSFSETLLRRSDKIAVSYSPLLNAVNVHRDPSPHVNVSRTPFDMGIMGRGENASPARFIEKSLQKSGGLSCELVGPEIIDGFSAEVVRFASSSNEVWTYYLDPARGFLPVKFTFDGANGRRARQVFITEIAACSRDRWLPIRSVVVSIPPSDTMSYPVSEFTITKVDLDHVPNERTFAIEVPEGASVYDMRDAKSRFHLTSNTRFTIDVGEQFLDNGGIATFTRSRHSTRWFIVGTAVGLLFLGGIALAVTRRRLRY